MEFRYHTMLQVPSGVCWCQPLPSLMSARQGIVYLTGAGEGEAGYRGSDDSQCHPTPSTWWISQLLPLFPQQPIKVSVIWVLWSSVWRTLECLSVYQSPVASITRSHKCRFPLSRCSVGSLLSHSGHFPQGCLGSKKILMQITASEMDLYTSIQSLLRHMW